MEGISKIAHIAYMQRKEKGFAVIEGDIGDNGKELFSGDSICSCVYWMNENGYKQPKERPI